MPQSKLHHLSKSGYTTHEKNNFQLAKCSNTVGSYACECNQGTTGDGRSCTDIDECSTKQHDCSYIGVCTNTEGQGSRQTSFTFLGRELNKRTLRTPVEGSFTCACAPKYIKRGYRGSGKKGDCCKMDGRGNRIGECH